ncbi:MAG: DUF433 domain-containing protein [Anaerolineae bacterium]
MAALVYAHIGFNDAGVPIISGTRTKVEEIVLDHIAYQWDADEIHDQHPHLTLAEIHSALAYYYDHQAEMDQQIEEGLRRVAEIRASMGESPIRLKLKASGLLP